MDPPKRPSSYCLERVESVVVDRLLEFCVSVPVPVAGCAPFEMPESIVVGAPVAPFVPPKLLVESVPIAALLPVVFMVVESDVVL